MDDLDLSKLGEPSSQQEAQLWNAVLSEAGIQAMVTGLEMSALGEALDGADVIEVFVPTAHLEKARHLMDRLLAEAEDPIPAWTCECGEEVDAGFFVCWSCEAEYTGDLGGGDEPSEMEAPTDGDDSSASQPE